ncbi:queuosine precursor transporter [Nitrolancea hollandica]|uniref:Probable queuosine precursor transporter n=1 Tax=Nitrolancea hollandica Lb TaxID=1129897 RepID=I4EFN6_9BACT|nr:conserved membrane hypothetical protein [Nitrolancea hollandica Lb]
MASVDGRPGLGSTTITNPADVTNRVFRYSNLVMVLFVAVLMISQTVASKIVSFGPFDFTAAIVIFPLGYMFGNILTEVYGYSRTRRVIWLGFVCAGLMSASYWIVGLLPPASGWAHQDAYMSILGVLPRVTFAGFLAYWAGEFLNSFVLAKMKVMTRGRFLWSRTIGSTIAGQGVDTLIFMLVAFYGVLPTPLLLSVAINSYWVKVLFEVVATPFTYSVVGFLKRSEGVDVYDHDTDFNPFRETTRISLIAHASKPAPIRTDGE